VGCAYLLFKEAINSIGTELAKEIEMKENSVS
jgi:hypothetical protein